MAVLILVLMEDTLRAAVAAIDYHLLVRLNPCFNGRYSQRCSASRKEAVLDVLILVLMEDTLREQSLNESSFGMKS